MFQFSYCCAPQLFFACTKITEEEKAVVGRYDLTEIIGLKNEDGDSDITADFFEENYIILNDDNSYKIYNKQAGYAYSTNGKWNLKGETLTLKLSGMFAKKENHTLKNNIITMTGVVNGKDVTMIFEKVSGQ